MEKINITINGKHNIGEVAKEIYGGFVEHLGRNVYGGVFDPDDPTADSDGQRTDVISLIRELNTPVTRYPGGCYTDNWYWEDGVGTDRPMRLDGAWKQKEPNTFGLHEFMRWTKKVGTEAVITLNLSTRGIFEAVQLLEYCNFPGNTELSNRRRKNGAEQPFNIRYWCLGNELHGSWETGQRSAKQYAWLARETAKAMKKIDPEVKLIVCGNPSDMEWNRIVLDCCYPYIDFISLHELFRFRTTTLEYLASVDVFEDKVVQTAEVIEAIRLLKRSDKQVKISIDEWIIWDCDRRRRDDEEWVVGPHLLEQDFTMPDTIVAGELLSLFHNLADRVTLACIAQSVNVIAPIRTAPGGVSWKQGLFYPFSLASNFGRGTALKMDFDHNDLRGSAILNHERAELVLFLINRNLDEAMLPELVIDDPEVKTVIDAVSLKHPDLKCFNTPGNEVLKPEPLEKVELYKQKLLVELPPLSWNMIRIKLG
ncbi:MAG: alpha-L-arabinofuranosidase C-terminal domain-containing protein [Victivallales bacterium]|nr:alpha-L-arabinofuranosidase C-terminal domain-containing protein [Victivallales bacterium]